MDGLNNAHIHGRLSPRNPFVGFFKHAPRGRLGRRNIFGEDDLSPEQIQRKRSRANYPHIGAIQHGHRESPKVVSPSVMLASSSASFTSHVAVCLMSNGFAVHPKKALDATREEVMIGDRLYGATPSSSGVLKSNSSSIGGTWFIASPSSLPHSASSAALEAIESQTLRLRERQSHNADAAIGLDTGRDRKKTRTPRAAAASGLSATSSLLSSDVMKRSSSLTTLHRSTGLSAVNGGNGEDDDEEEAAELSGAERNRDLEGKNRYRQQEEQKSPLKFTGSRFLVIGAGSGGQAMRVHAISENTSSQPQQKSSGSEVMMVAPLQASGGGLIHPSLIAALPNSTNAAQSPNFSLTFQDDYAALNGGAARSMQNSLFFSPSIQLPLPSSSNLLPHSHSETSSSGRKTHSALWLQRKGGGGNAWSPPSPVHTSTSSPKSLALLMKRDGAYDGNSTAAAVVGGVHVDRSLHLIDEHLATSSAAIPILRRHSASAAVSSSSTKDHSNLHHQGDDGEAGGARQTFAEMSSFGSSSSNESSQHSPGSSSSSLGFSSILSPSSGTTASSTADYASHPAASFDSLSLPASSSSIAQVLGQVPSGISAATAAATSSRSPTAPVLSPASSIATTTTSGTGSIAVSASSSSSGMRRRLRASSSSSSLLLSPSSIRLPPAPELRRMAQHYEELVSRAMQAKAQAEAAHARALSLMALSPSSGSSTSAPDAASLAASSSASRDGNRAGGGGAGEVAIGGLDGLVSDGGGRAVGYNSSSSSSSRQVLDGERFIWPSFDFLALNSGDPLSDDGGDGGNEDDDDDAKEEEEEEEEGGEARAGKGNASTSRNSSLPPLSIKTRNIPKASSTTQSAPLLSPSSSHAVFLRPVTDEFVMGPIIGEGSFAAVRLARRRGGALVELPPSSESPAAAAAVLNVASSGAHAEEGGGGWHYAIKSIKKRLLLAHSSTATTTASTASSSSTHPTGGIPASSSSSSSRGSTAADNREAASREWSIHRAAQHDHIVPLRECYEDPRDPDQLIHLVMERCPGGDLKAFLRNRGVRRVSEAQTRLIAEQLLSALDHLHNVVGALHGDVKPSNVLIAEAPFAERSVASSVANRMALESMSNADAATAAAAALATQPISFISHVKLCDFGSARRTPDLKNYIETGDVNLVAWQLTGTLGYVAPECLSRKPFGAACDIWSLGIILFELIAGHPPFFPYHTCLKEPVKFEDSIWAGVSSDAQALIRSMLALDPARRVSAAVARAHPWLYLQHR